MQTQTKTKRKTKTKTKARTKKAARATTARGAYAGGRRIFIVDGIRTPFLRADAPGVFSASDLAVAAGRALLARQPFAPDAFDEVVLGCIAPSANEANIARVASLRLGCGDATPAFSVARNCASGMQALDSAANNIALGRADLMLAGGCESMSRSPVLFRNDFVAWLGKWMKAKTMLARLQTLTKLKPASLKPVIGLLQGLTDPVVGMNMGQTAEKIARRFHITREQMDAFAARSHARLAAAGDNGYFENELTPIYDYQGGRYAADNGLRRDSGLENLAKLRPAFDRPSGNVTAGNSAQITDGCAWLILASEAGLKKHKLKARAEITDCAWAGLDATQMGLGPAHAGAALLARHAMQLRDVDYWEINEAFAAQVLACLAAWRDADYCKNELNLPDALGELDQSRLNLDGGGVSIGHPVGASGARIVLHALHVLERRKWRRAVATLCIGGGQGGAMMIERATK